MGYATLVRKQVRLAFGMVKDLATTVTLSRANDTSFDFTTGVASSVSISTMSIKGILTAKKKKPGGTQLDTSTEMEMLFRAEDLPDPTVYDTITMPNGDIWRAVPPYSNDGYLITVNVTRVE